MPLDENFLKQLDLSLPKLRDLFVNTTKDFIRADNVRECQKMDELIEAYFRLHPNLEKNQSDIYQELLALQRVCYWISMPINTEEKVSTCYNKYINIAWEIPEKYNFAPQKPDSKYSQQEYLLKNKLQQRLHNIYSFPERDKLKNKILEALRNSEEIITEKRIIRDSSSNKATLSLWFEIYFEAVGTGEPNKLKIAEFFTKNKNFQQLTEANKAKLRIIFWLYEMMKLSSTIPEGNEEEIPYQDEQGMGVLQYGKLERYNKEDLEFYNKFIKNNWDILSQAKVTQNLIYPVEHKEETKINPTKKMDKLMAYQQINEPKGVVHDIFNEHDQQEIADHKPSGLKKLPANDSQQIMATLKQNLSLTFKEIALETRFDSLIVSYIRGLRDAMELKESLTKTTDVGGMGFGWDVAEKIVATLKGKNIATPIAEIKIVSGTMPAAAIKKPALPSFSDMQAMMKKTNAKSTKLPPIKPVVPPAPMVISAKNSLPKKEYSAMIPQVKRLNPSKPIVQDIKMPPKDIKLVGPLEELQFIDVNKFRRSAETSVEAAEKIKAKIDLLEEQSFTEKAKGIVAFKNSPLNKMYLKVGNKSIEAGRSVVEVIAELTQAGEATLTKEEFDVIADLNKKLRF